MLIPSFLTLDFARRRFRVIIIRISLTIHPRLDTLVWLISRLLALIGTHTQAEFSASISLMHTVTILVLYSIFPFCLSTQTLRLGQPVSLIVARRPVRVLLNPTHPIVYSMYIIDYSMKRKGIMFARHYLLYPLPSIIARGPVPLCCAPNRECVK